MDWETWGLPLLILSGGLSVGIFLATRTQTPDSGARPEEDLTARKEALLEQIRELDADRDKMEAADYAARREQLIDAAAQTQRALSEPVAAAPAPTRITSNRQVVGWVAATLLFFVLLGGLIQRYAAPRVEGGSMTGNSGSSTMAEIAAAREARLSEATEALREDPTNIEALNTLAYDALLYRDLDSAMSYLDRAREIAPTDNNVQVNLAILQMSVGMVDRAKAALSGVLEAEPGNGRAWLWQGFMQANTGEKEAAIETLTHATTVVAWPEEKLFAENMLRELTAPPPTVRLTGSVAMAEGTERPEGVLYIYARRAEVSAGPPVAALKHAGGVPLSFEITDADMVMGGAWPEQTWMQARIDADGDPMTRDDTTAESAVVGPLASGAAGITLILTPTDAGSEAPTEQPAGPRLSGTIDYAGTAPAGSVVFVTVRREGVSSGPPVAAKRLEPTAFPLSFTVTDADMMLGGAWPEAVTVSARLDLDANAMTRDEGDATSAVVGPLSSGAGEISLTLDGVLRE